MTSSSGPNGTGSWRGKCSASSRSSSWAGTFRWSRIRRGLPSSSIVSPERRPTLCFQLMAPETELERTEHGLVPRGEGWFVLNMRDAEWRHADGRGAVCVVADDFEGERQFEQLGFNPFGLGPGEPMAMYHCEGDQEGFLVLSGEAVLIV